jgi:hypothetical protein
LLIGQIYSVPIDATGYFEFTNEPTFTTSTTTSTTTTTTTTTLAPEVDREWEDLVLAGPTVVNYLSLFMVFASRKDISLNPSVEHTNQVRSLRDILSQISSAMKAAFQVAHDDLIRTRVSMEQIPDHIKAGLLLIKTAPKDLLKQLLPYTLQNVDRAASEGSAVAKPTLARFVSVGLLIDELVTLLASTTSTPEIADYLIEAHAYASDIKKQWDLLVQLFKKFSYRADITQQSISTSFSDSIKEAQSANNFASEAQRSAYLDILIPATIAIDQSSSLLNMMSTTYTEVSNDHMVNQIASNYAYLVLGVESARTTSQRELWQNTVSQSVKVARLAQKRHNEFAATSPKRHEEYSDYSKSVIAA